MELQFRQNLIIKGKITTRTGLHIGGSVESIEIGGVDNIIIRDPRNKLPYIPGSSLKGKMRTLLELSDPIASKSVVANGGKPCQCGKCIVCQLFGTSAAEVERGPTRLIVRDSWPTDETKNGWEDEAILGGVEVKYENTINRITSEANPRPSERVPQDSQFEFEMVLSIYHDQDFNLITTLLQAMKLLEDNYLGGSGSRGYGKIEFQDVHIIKRSLNYYKGTQDETETASVKSVTDLIKDQNLIKKIKGN